MASRSRPVVLAAIDVGTNAVRLKIVRLLSDGSLLALHEERDAVRPGEGVFKTRVMRKEVADRLITTLRRYAALCQRHGARVRAVATSAIREARNGDEIVRRVARECGIELDVISGIEEARLICLGVLRGKRPRERSLLIDIGGGSTEVSTALGQHPTRMWSISLGAVRLSETFECTDIVAKQQLATMRAFAAEAVAETLPPVIKGSTHNALGTSGSIRAVIGFCAAPGTAHATRKQLARAVKELAAMTRAERRQRFDPSRAEIVLAGAVIIEALARHLELDAVTAVSSGLRDGILVDLIQRHRGLVSDPSLSEAAIDLGRRFAFAEAHARQVARLALALFDELRTLHGLPDSARPLLEVAALLHDIGHAVNYHKHHRHTFYMIHNTDIPGLSYAQRDLVARIARFHRGGAPDFGHEGLAGLTLESARLVRKLATLLRLADAFDRSHHQPVSQVHARLSGHAVRIRLVSARPIDLEMWDAERDAKLFFAVFRKRLVIVQART